MEYAIEVRNLTKRYKGFSLDDISFALPRGTVMGLIGENGAGKSTLINSILGILDSESDLTAMLGLDMKTHSKKIKEDIAVIFNDSHYDVNLTPKIIGHILSKVYKNWDAPLFFEYLERFDLPEKKKIKKLSTGMRVKLEFAAALSHHPKLLILDEATSSVDTRTEVLIQKAMDNLMKGRTSFVIAHRLSTIRDADLILVMKDGDIVERGRHEELLARKGFYSEIYSAQFE